VKVRLALISAGLAVGLVSQVVTSTSASAVTTVHKAIFQGDGCGIGNPTKMGNATISRNGTQVRVSVNGGLPASSTFVIEIMNGGCNQVGADSKLFSVDSAGYFEGSWTFPVPRSTRKMFIQVVDNSTGDNQTTFFKIAP